MDFQEYLPKYHKMVNEKIKGMTFASRIDGYIGDQVIDYYGVDGLKSIIDQIPDSTYFVTILFCEALVDAALGGCENSIPKKYKRNVLVINSYNCYEPLANITHRRPQIILGLKSEWNERDILVFKKLVREYFAHYSSELTETFFQKIKSDGDLLDKNTDYKNSLGIEICKETLDAFEVFLREL